MDDKTKLYVFAKTEVALIFLFVLIIICIAFLFGFKVGRSYSFESMGIKPQDQKALEFLSEKEEEVEEAVREHHQDDSSEKLESGDLNEQLEKRIKEELLKGEENELVQKEELKKEAQKNSVGEKDLLSEGSPEGEVVGQEQKQEQDNKQDKDLDQKRHQGKYTVQVGSHRSLKDAQAFAEGFRIRDYEPIINEVKIPNLGTWHRVSLGVFDTLSQAKEFVKRENSLFQDQDYVFVRFE